MSARYRPLAVLAALLLALGACSSSGQDDETTDEGQETTEARADEAEGTFPATVEHRHGETVVEAMPEKIVTVGYSDQDAVLAFGVAPIAVTDWYGDHEHATWEWAQDELGDAEPEVLNQGEFTGTADYDLEQISACWSPTSSSASTPTWMPTSTPTCRRSPPPSPPRPTTPSTGCPGRRSPAWSVPPWAGPIGPRS